MIQRRAILTAHLRQINDNLGQNCYKISQPVIAWGGNLALWLAERCRQTFTMLDVSTRLTAEWVIRVHRGGTSTELEANAVISSCFLLTLVCQGELCWFVFKLMCRMLQCHKLTYIHFTHPWKSLTSTLTFSPPVKRFHFSSDIALFV